MGLLSIFVCIVHNCENKEQREKGGPKHGTEKKQQHKKKRRQNVNKNFAIVQNQQKFIWHSAFIVAFTHSPIEHTHTGERRE